MQVFDVWADQHVLNLSYANRRENVTHLSPNHGISSKETFIENCFFIEHFDCKYQQKISINCGHNFFYTYMSYKHVKYLYGQISFNSSVSGVDTYFESLERYFEALT